MYQPIQWSQLYVTLLPFKYGEPKLGWFFFFLHETLMDFNEDNFFPSLSLQFYLLQQTQEIHNRCLVSFSDSSIIFFILRWPFKQSFSKNQKTWLPKGENVLVSKRLHYYSSYQVCVAIAFWLVYGQMYYCSTFKNLFQ